MGSTENTVLVRDSYSSSNGLSVRRNIVFLRRTLSFLFERISSDRDKHFLQQRRKIRHELLKSNTSLHISLSQVASSSSSANRSSSSIGSYISPCAVSEFSPPLAISPPLSPLQSPQSSAGTFCERIVHIHHHRQLATESNPIGADKTSDDSLGAPVEDQHPATSQKDSLGGSNDNQEHKLSQSPPNCGPGQSLAGSKRSPFSFPFKHPKKSLYLLLSLVYAINHNGSHAMEMVPSEDAGQDSKSSDTYLHSQDESGLKPPPYKKKALGNISRIPSHYSQSGWLLPVLVCGFQVGLDSSKQSQSKIQNYRCIHTSIVWCPVFEKGTSYIGPTLPVEFSHSQATYSQSSQARSSLVFIALNPANIREKAHSSNTTTTSTDSIGAAERSARKRSHDHIDDLPYSIHLASKLTRHCHGVLSNLKVIFDRYSSERVVFTCHHDQNPITSMFHQISQSESQKEEGKESVPLSAIISSSNNIRPDREYSAAEISQLPFLPLDIHDESSFDCNCSWLWGQQLLFNHWVAKGKNNNKLDSGIYLQHLQCFMPIDRLVKRSSLSKKTELMVCFRASWDAQEEGERARADQWLIEKIPSARKPSISEATKSNILLLDSHPTGTKKSLIVKQRPSASELLKNVFPKELESVSSSAPIVYFLKKPLPEELLYSRRKSLKGLMGCREQSYSYVCLGCKRDCLTLLGLLIHLFQEHQQWAISYEVSRCPSSLSYSSLSLLSSPLLFNLFSSL